MQWLLLCSWASSISSKVTIWVVRHVGRLLDGNRRSIPFELVTDGDLLLLVEKIFVFTVWTQFGLPKLKVMLMRVWFLTAGSENLTGWVTTLADEASDFGRRRADNTVIDARRNLSGICGRWYLLFLVFIGSSLSSPGQLLSMTGMMVLLLIVRFEALVLFPTSVGWFKLMRIVSCCLDHQLFGCLVGSVGLLLFSVLIDDVDHCIGLNSTGLLVKWVAFLGTLHWPAGDVALRVGGISYFELLILYEQWVGERLSLETAHLRYLRPGRPISVWAVSFGPGIDIWRSCRFIGTLMRSLCLLPGWLGKFVSCSMVPTIADFVILGGKNGSWTYFETTKKCFGGFLG